MSELEGLANQVHNLKSQLDSLKSEFHDLKEEMHSKQEKSWRKKAKRMIDQAAGELEHSIHAHIKQINKSLDRVEKGLVEHDDELQKVKDEKGNIHDYHALVNKSLDDFRKKLEELDKGTTHPVVAEVKKIKPRVDELSKKVVMTSMKNDFLEKTLKKLEQNFVELGLSVKEKADHDHLAREVEKLENDLMNRFDADLEKVEELVHNTREDLREDIQVLEKGGNQALVKKKLGEFRSLYSSFNKKLEKLNQEYAKRVSELVEHINSLKSHVIAGKAENKRLRKKFSQITGEKHDASIEDEVDYLDRERRRFK